MRIWLEGGEKGVRIGIRIGVVGLDGLDWDRGGGSGLMMMGSGLDWFGLDWIMLDRIGDWTWTGWVRGKCVHIGVGDGGLEWEMENWREHRCTGRI